jgi:hypothetical protein
MEERATMIQKSVERILFIHFCVGQRCLLLQSIPISVPQIQHVSVCQIVHLSCSHCERNCWCYASERKKRGRAGFVEFHFYQLFIQSHWQTLVRQVNALKLSGKFSEVRLALKRPKHWHLHRDIPVRLDLKPIG